jgi:GT2 family glycosyltransferase
MVKRISVIFPVFNAKKYLVEYFPTVVASMRASERLNNGQFEFSAVVVDDGSTDQTSDYLKSNFPFVHVVMGTGSLWWSGSCNKGIEYCISHLSPDFIMLWNIDTLPEENYFTNLAEIILQAEMHDIIGSKVYLKNSNRIFSYGGGWNSRNGKMWNYGFGEVDNEKYQQPALAEWNGGMGTIFPTQLIHDIGYIDEKNFPQYFGDSDFFLRAGYKGYRMMISPKLVIWNDEDNSGISNNLKLKSFFMGLYSIKSTQNIFIKWKFYKRHLRSSTGWISYFRSTIDYAYQFAKQYIKMLFSGGRKELAKPGKVVG